MNTGYPFIEVDHGSQAWHSIRAGKITCSNFLAVMTTGTGTPWGTPAKAYAEQLAVELCQGRPADEVSAPALTWGKDYEEDARTLYMERTMHFVPRPNRMYYRPGTLIGGTPDGIIGEDGGLEIKCPKDSRVHLRTMITRSSAGERGIVPPEHIPQIMGYLWITGRDWWDFTSFDPRWPQEEQQIFVKRVHRLQNETYIFNLSQRVQAFQGLVLGIAREMGTVVDPAKAWELPAAQSGSEGVE